MTIQRTHIDHLREQLAELDKLPICEAEGLRRQVQTELDEAVSAALQDCGPSATTRALAIIDQAIHDVTADSYTCPQPPGLWEQCAAAHVVLIDAQNYVRDHPWESSPLPTSADAMHRALDSLGMPIPSTGKHFCPDCGRVVRGDTCFDCGATHVESAAGIPGEYRYSYFNSVTKLESSPSPIIPAAELDDMACEGCDRTFSMDSEELVFCGHCAEQDEDTILCKPCMLKPAPDPRDALIEQLCGLVEDAIEEIHGPDYDGSVSEHTLDDLRRALAAAAAYRKGGSR